MSDFYVYEHWRADTDSCFYVGKGRAYRAYEMNKRNPYHVKIRTKVVSSGSSVEIRIIHENLSEPEAFRLEIETIKHWRAMGVKLANIVDGGKGVSGFKRPPRTPEHKERHAEAMRRHVITPEHRAKLSVAGKGRVLTAEERQKISASKLGKPCSDAVRRKISEANKGKKQSEETRTKKNAALRGRVRSEEPRAKMSAARKGMRFSEEHRANLSAAKRRFYQKRASA